MISEYIESNLKQGHIKIYPYSRDIKELGFYMLIHESTRIADNNKSYQCTLFLKDKPYCHDFSPLWDIINHIESNDYKIEDNILYSMMCDDSVMELAEVKEIPSNEKIENIHVLVDKYNEKLELVQEENTHDLIKSLFDEYIKTDKYTLEQVENILNSLLR